MTCRQCQGIECLFDRREALRKLSSYQRQGPSQTARLLLDAVKAAGVEGATLLDIGGGVGVAQLELLAAGLRSATDVDASSAYLDVAREEAQRRGYGDAGELSPRRLRRAGARRSSRLISLRWIA